jgi:hypothetical protein
MPNDAIVLRDGARILYASVNHEEIAPGEPDAGLPLPPGAETPALRLLRYDKSDPGAGPLDVDADFAHGLAIGLVLFDADDRLTWFNETYRGVMGANGHLLQLGKRFEDIMSAAYRAGHAAGDAADMDSLIATRLARHRNHETFEEALSGGRTLLTQEIAVSDGGTLGVRTIL